jgi:hypothetical protein
MSVPYDGNHVTENEGKEITSASSKQQLPEKKGIYVGYPESKFRWAIEKKKQLIFKPFILPFDVHTLHYFLTYRSFHHC